MEPELQTVGALFSPETGILDSHAFMLALQGEAVEAGADFAFRTPFVSAARRGDRAGPRRRRRTHRSERARADQQRRTRTPPLSRAPSEGVGRGQSSAHAIGQGKLFCAGGRAPFERLIYPAPQVHGLGVHLTFDLAGEARFGPMWNGSTTSTMASTRTRRGFRRGHTPILAGPAAARIDAGLFGHPP